jgi:hypothetical protein
MYMLLMYMGHVCLYCTYIHVLYNVLSQTRRLNRERLRISKYLLSYYVECN